MDKLNTETKPSLYKDGKKLTAVAVADPSVTIIEVHDAFGFLLAESCYDSLEGAKLHLENVNWVHQDHKTGNKSFRSFAEIAIYHHDSDCFVAQDMESGNYLPSPSTEPYAVISISKQQYDELYEQIQKEAIEQMLDSLKPVIRRVQGFSFRGNTLVAPRRYARAARENLGRRMIEA